jgi:Family of unknown function (DUF6600)
MKPPFSPKFMWEVSLAFLLFAGQCLFSHAQPAPPPEAGSTAAISTDAAEPSDTVPDIPPDSPLAQVVKLTQSGVDESVIMSFATNSDSLFNLTSDDIIYLKDLGLPNDIVTAMMQRDQQLKQMGEMPNAQPVTTTSSETETSPPPESADVTDNYFYDTLAPYGSWVDIEGYGLCWQPTVVIYNSNWQPYCDHGHWVYTDSGWYWVSDYSWGACTFHYGRWFHDPHRGWCWWPDTVWGPSWVCWRYANDYCGWAPLPPHTVYQAGVGILYNGVAVSANFNFGLGANFFTFVPTRYFCDPHPRRHLIARTQVAQIFNHTRIINNFNVNSRNHAIINGGIAPERITAVTKTPVQRLVIRDAPTRVARVEQIQHDELAVYRPHFTAASVATLRQGVAPHPRPGPLPLRNNNPAHPPVANQNPPEIHRVVPQEQPPHNVVPPVNNRYSPTQNKIEPQNNYSQPPNNQSPPGIYRVSPQELQQHNITPQPDNHPLPSSNQKSVPNYNQESQRYLPPRMREQSPRTVPPVAVPERRTVSPSQPVQQNNNPHFESHSAPPAPMRVTPQTAPPAQNTPSHNTAPVRSQPNEKDKNQH